MIAALKLRSVEPALVGEDNPLSRDQHMTNYILWRISSISTAAVSIKSDTEEEYNYDTDST